MKTNVKSILTVCTIICFFVFAIASNTMKHLTYTKEGGQIPPEFEAFKDTLLVIKDPSDYRYYGRYLEKNLKDNYTKKYKFITPAEVSKYPVDQYRYSFDHKVKWVIRSTNDNGRIHDSKGIESEYLFLTDRKTGAIYKTGSSSHFSELMKQYFTALNDVK